MISNGIASAQPESVRGTIGMISAMPTVLSANPSRTMLLGRHLPAPRPASIATPNMLSESGARVNPVFMALYSRVICRKIGSAIIAPPSVTFCSICPEIPVVKCGNPKRPGSSNVGFP